MFIHTKTLVLITALAWLAGCAVSHTEADFGNSVRNVVDKQQMRPTGPLKADEPIQGGDGRRLENVNTVYQTQVGDPSPVVRQIEVDAEAGGR